MSFFFLQNVLVLKDFCCSFSLSQILPNLYHQPRFASFIGSSAVWHSNDIESLARRPVSPEYPPECLYFKDRRSNNELRKSSKNFNKHTFFKSSTFQEQVDTKGIGPENVNSCYMQKFCNFSANLVHILRFRVTGKFIGATCKLSWIGTWLKFSRAQRGFTGLFSFELQILICGV